MTDPSIQRPGTYGPTTSDDLAKAALVEEEPKTENKKTPIERWQEAIEAAGITQEEANQILDSILTTGFFEKSYKIFRGKLSIILRSRDSASLQRVSEALDIVRTNDPRVHTQTMNRFNLAASLVRYQDKIFKIPGANSEISDREKAFNERLAFVDTIPSPIVIQLYMLLGKFDAAVFAALTEGAEMGF